MIVTVALVYSLPFESRRWALTTILSWADADSDINFYNRNLLSVMMGRPTASATGANEDNNSRQLCPDSKGI
jgi:hypothetical protein